MPTERHSWRCRASSTSRTIGLFRTSFLIAYSKSIAAHASLSIARSLALRARGLRATSSSPGTTGLRGQDAQRASPAAERPERVLDDAILERVERDHREPRARRAAGATASARNVSRPSSSRLTQMRSAWNVRVAGSIRW